MKLNTKVSAIVHLCLSLKRKRKKMHEEKGWMLRKERKEKKCCVILFPGFPPHYLYTSYLDHISWPFLLLSPIDLCIYVIDFMA